MWLYQRQFSLLMNTSLSWIRDVYVRISVLNHAKLQKVRSTKVGTDSTSTIQIAHQWLANDLDLEMIMMLSKMRNMWLTPEKACYCSGDFVFLSKCSHILTCHPQVILLVCKICRELVAGHLSFRLNSLRINDPTIVYPHTGSKYRNHPSEALLLAFRRFAAG